MEDALEDRVQSEPPADRLARLGGGPKVKCLVCGKLSGKEVYVRLPQMRTHVAAHILWKDVDSSSCGFCGRMGTCSSWLEPGTAKNIEVPASNCPYFYKFSNNCVHKKAGRARCSNAPMRCTACVDTPTYIWKYDMRRHWQVHHAGQMAEHPSNSGFVLDKEEASLVKHSLRQGRADDKERTAAEQRLSQWMGHASHPPPATTTTSAGAAALSAPRLTQRRGAPDQIVTASTSSGAAAASRGAGSFSKARTAAPGRGPGRDGGSSTRLASGEAPGSATPGGGATLATAPQNMAPGIELLADTSALMLAPPAPATSGLRRAPANSAMRSSGTGDEVPYVEEQQARRPRPAARAGSRMAQGQGQGLDVRASASAHMPGQVQVQAPSSQQHTMAAPTISGSSLAALARNARVVAPPATIPFQLGPGSAPALAAAAAAPAASSGDGGGGPGGGGVSINLQQSYRVVGLLVRDKKSGAQKLYRAALEQQAPPPPPAPVSRTREMTVALGDNSTSGSGDASFLRLGSALQDGSQGSFPQPPYRSQGVGLSRAELPSSGQQQYSHSHRATPAASSSAAGPISSSAHVPHSRLALGWADTGHGMSSAGGADTFGAPSHVDVVFRVPYRSVADAVHGLGGSGGGGAMVAPGMSMLGAPRLGLMPHHHSLPPDGMGSSAMMVMHGDQGPRFVAAPDGGFRLMYAPGVVPGLPAPPAGPMLVSAGEHRHWQSAMGQGPMPGGAETSPTLKRRLSALIQEGSFDDEVDGRSFGRR